MKHNKTKKKFDAVAMMRQIRNKLSQKYLENPSAEVEDLRMIREKYGIKIKEKI
jgi:hypothetical protein